MFKLMIELTFGSEALKVAGPAHEMGMMRSDGEVADVVEVFKLYGDLIPIPAYGVYLSQSGGRMQYAELTKTELAG